MNVKDFLLANKGRCKSLPQQFKQSLIVVLVVLASISAQAKKNQAETNPRLQSLSAENKQMFSDLTPKQQNTIKQMKVQPGFNSWMVELALGKPYYKSEHHPVYQDYEQVWLYTKADVNEQSTKEKVKDEATGWPMWHTTTQTKTCLVGDFFLLFDRGVVEKIVSDKSGKTYGSCTIETQESFIPIK